MEFKKCFWNLVIPALFSGLVSVPVTFFLTVKYEKERVAEEYRMEVFQGVVGYRYILNQPNNSGNEKLSSAMNQIPFAFSSSENVVSKFNEFYRVRTNASFGVQANNDAFINLIYAMMDELNIPRGSISDKNLERVFTVGS